MQKINYPPTKLVILDIFVLNRQSVTKKLITQKLLNLGIEHSINIYLQMHVEFKNTKIYGVFH